MLSKTKLKQLFGNYAKKQIKERNLAVIKQLPPKLELMVLGCLNFFDDAQPLDPLTEARFALAYEQHASKIDYNKKDIQRFCDNLSLIEDETAFCPNLGFYISALVQKIKKKDQKIVLHLKTEKAIDFLPVYLSETTLELKATGGDYCCAMTNNSNITFEGDVYDHFGSCSEFSELELRGNCGARLGEEAEDCNIRIYGQTTTVQFKTGYKTRVFLNDRQHYPPYSRRH